MTRFGAMLAPATVAACIALSSGSAPASADSPVPQAGTSCSAALSGAMTALPDRGGYLVCQGEPNASNNWVPVVEPFPPNDKWLSYGPAMTLHGEGLRNPNLSSGQWTATPQDPGATCTAEQVTVVRAGVVAPPEVSAGEQGQPLSLEVLPRLFSIKLSGDCLWSQDQVAGADR